MNKVILSKYSFKARLIVGFGVIILFNIFSILFALKKLNDLNKDLITMYNHPLAVSNSLREINTNINAIHRTMKDIVLSESLSQMESEVMKVSLIDKKIHDEFSIVSNRFLGDIKDVHLAYETYKKWEPIRNEVIQLMRKGEMSKAADITRGKGLKHIKLLLKHTQVMIDFAKDKADQLYSESILKKKEAQYVLIVLISIIFALSIVIALAISYSISHPINSLVRRIRQNFKLNEVEIDVEHKKKISNEQGMLESSVTLLEKTTIQLRDWNLKLEEKVKERTTKIQKNEALLKETNKSLEDLVYVASHDLQVPLISMDGYATELLENNSDKLDEEGVFCLKRLQANAQRMHNLVLSLLNISRLNTNKHSHEKFDLNLIINEIVMDLSLTIDEKKAIVKYDKLPILLADKLRIENVFRNLISNALNYGGKTIVISFNKDTISVKDDGIGIPKDQLEKIFNPGEQLKIVKTDGVGMGLAFCKKVIEQHNGKICAKSDGQNKGATIHIKLMSNNIASQYE